MKKKFNILYVIEGGPNWGGAEKNLLNVLRVIDRNRFSVEVCCLVGGSVAEEFKTADVPVTVLDMRDKWDYRAVLRLASLLTSKDTHIIHTCLYASNTFGRIAAFIARTPVTVAWEQSMAYVKPRRHVWVDWFLNKFTHFIVAPSEAVRQSIIEKEGISGEKIEVLHNIIVDSEFTLTIDTKTKRAELGIEQDDIVIGCVANLSEHKGQKYLVEAVPQIIRSFPNIKCLLIGDGPLRSELEDNIKRMGLESKIILTGFRRDIPELLSIMDLYVQPSLREAFAVSMMEAMFMGKPVVASRVGGTPEMVRDGETGILIPARDSRGIAEAVLELLKDKERASEMGRAGSERIKAYFTAEATVAKLEKLYEKFIVTAILAGEKSLDRDEEDLRKFWIKKYFSCHTVLQIPLLEYEHEVRQEGLLKLLKLMPGEMVLDFGCGRCGDIQFLSSSGARFTGIDLSEVAVREGRERLTGDVKETPLIVADGVCLPFKSNVFDKVFCKESLEHIPHYEEAIEEIARVLRPGGVVAVTCPNWLSMKGLGRLFGWLKLWLVNRSESHPYDDWKTQRVMERCLRKHGFEIREKLGIDFSPGVICYKLSDKSQIRLVAAIRVMESRFLWRLTAFGNAVGLSAMKKSGGR